MPKRSSRQEDINELAFRIGQQATGQQEQKPPAKEKNPAAVALGRLGGIKGGKARAKALSPAQRKAIAKKAAISRWNKQA